jgi:creatinine amidohydrolase
VIANLPVCFDECTWEELAVLPKSRVVLILPVGATEPHGPHLPLATDVLISREMARRAALILRERGTPAFVLPPIVYSITDFASGFAGAVSIRFETARDVIRDVASSLIGSGFTRLCIANSHLEPAHVDSLNVALAEVRASTGVDVAFPDKRRRRWAETLTDEFRSGACHAGQYETSLVLAVRPDLVRDQIRAGLAPVPDSLSDAIKRGRTDFREAGGARAYFGWPADATAAEGDRTYQALAAMLVTAVDETFGTDNGVPHSN